MKTRQAEPPTIERLIELQTMLLQFRAIERSLLSIGHKDGRVAENDAEHSYALAMAAWFLAAHFPKLDSGKLIRYALAHDLLEIHAGDTSVFADKEMLASKAEREAQAVAQLAREWADFPELVEAIRAYEARDSEEAKFVYALDKVMPIILNNYPSRPQLAGTQDNAQATPRRQKRQSKRLAAHQCLLRTTLRTLARSPRVFPSSQAKNHTSCWPSSVIRAIFTSVRQGSSRLRQRLRPTGSWLEHLFVLFCGGVAQLVRARDS